MMASVNTSWSGNIVGFLHDRYELGELLGAGSMGRVFAAHDKLLCIDVAVKMLNPDLLHSRKHMDLFTAEGTIASRMLSRHVVKVLGLAETFNGIPCIIYERLEGETLGERIEREGGVSLTMTVEIVKQVSHALARAHSIGVIHRDVKPDNIFLTRDADGRLLVKLLDFGIALTADSTGGYSHYYLAGTPEYMAPEVLLATGAVDRCGDIYALGVVAFECLTGRCPVAGPIEVVAASLRAGTRAPFTELRPDLQGSVDAWMDRALHPDPFWRFGSIKELRDGLEDAIGSSTKTGPMHVVTSTLRAA